MNDIKLIYNNYLDFYPTSKMRSKEKILSLIRLNIYLGMISVVIFRRVVIIFLILGFILYGLYRGVEEFELDDCDKASYENPAMNETYVDRLLGRKKRACDDKDGYNEYLRNNLYENESDIFFSRNQERIFYTQPVTELLTDQDEYLDFLYPINKTCKMDRFNCLPHDEDLTRKNKI
jgi:hypothetical protein